MGKSKKKKMKVRFNFQVGDYYRMEDKVVTPKDREWRKLNNYQNIISNNFPIDEPFTLITLHTHHQVPDDYLLVEKKKLPSGKFRILPIMSYTYLYHSYRDSSGNKKYKITQ